MLKYIDGNNHKICILHYESNMYLSVKPQNLAKGDVIPLCLTHKLNKFCEFEL
jgi:hypothetical protein